MNGPQNGLVSNRGNQSDPILNNQAFGSTASLSSQIQQALEIVYNQFSSQESRKEASAYLEQIKTNEEAPRHGFTLASDSTQQPAVRHFALSLLEYAIRYKWMEYSESQEKVLQQWVIHLAQNIQPNDPAYLRNKVSQIWGEITKRSSGPSWNEMNEMAVKLWNMPDMIYKEFVLATLEILSEDIFNKDDAIPLIYANNIRKSCIDIFTPVEISHEALPNQEGTVPVQHEEGWLTRISKFLDYCVANSLHQVPQALKCMLRALSIYKSVMPWATSKAIDRSMCVYFMTRTIALPNTSIQIASVEALHGLYNRAHFTDENFISLICPTFTHQMVDTYQKLFEWSLVDPHDIDDEKYLFAKKFSEMISILGGLIENKFSIIPEVCDVPNLLNLFLAIAQSTSLVISIPALHVWTRLLRPENIAALSRLDSFVAPLLQLASSRLIRYDVIPEDSDDPCMIFLLEDIDTVPERHAFLGNYRRYSVLIIELIVRLKKSEAIEHILRQAEVSLKYLHDGEPKFCVERYCKTSLHLLRVDAYLVVVETAMKTYMKLGPDPPKSPPEVQSGKDLESFLEAWCERLLSIRIKDPIIKKRVNQLVVAFSTSILNQRVGFMLRVLENILLEQSPERPEFPNYNQALREMQIDGMYELQRLAMKMPNHLLDVYDRLEETVNQILASDTIDKRRKIAYQSFLLTVIHRSTKLAPQVRSQKLDNFIQPVCALWQNQSLEQALSTFDGFRGILGLDTVMSYLSGRKIYEYQDWSMYKLDAEGYTIQQELDKRIIALPLQATKSFLQSTTDRLELGAPELKNSSGLWKLSLPIILPKLLKFLGYAHAVHNSANWEGLPPGMISVVSRILSDRFWQAGISEGSKEEFYARVSNTKSTMEGLASSIRGSLRSIRESSYAIIGCLSKFGADFYGISDIPGPMAHSFFFDASHLSSHQLINLIQVVRVIIDNCPTELRGHFIPPMLSSCFSQLDAKCTTQWEKLRSRQGSATPGENLTDEMKEESLLRQLTHNAVVIIGAILDPQRKNNLVHDQTFKDASSISVLDSSTEPLSMRDFCLSSPSILESVLPFMSHVITMHDTRSCGIVLRMFRSIIPEFSKNQALAKGNQNNELLSSIREFICRDVLMACITSLNEPYFVDLQKDLAQCIVSIIVGYHEESTTPRQILLSIPSLQEKAVDNCLKQLNQSLIQIRHQRALVLELLGEIKGVSISEQGRIQNPASSVRKGRSQMQQAYMNAPDSLSKSNGSPIMESLSSMFGES